MFLYDCYQSKLIDIDISKKKSIAAKQSDDYHQRRIEMHFTRGTILWIEEELLFGFGFILRAIVFIKAHETLQKYQATHIIYIDANKARRVINWQCRITVKGGPKFSLDTLLFSRVQMSNRK